MTIKRIVLILAFLIAALVASSFYVFNTYMQATANIASAKEMVERTEKQMIGYTKYKEYLVQGKASLQQQIKLLTAKVVRKDDTWIEHVERGWGPLKTTAAVSIKYTTEYSFGYDLSPNNYDVRENKEKTGIDIVLNRPILVSSPAVLSNEYEVLNGGVFISSKEEVLKLYERLPAITLSQGTTLAASPEVVALCEKSLIAFFRDFLSKQPGVLAVPNIQIVYK